jgi:uncharacterized protein (DUF4415 family)
MSKPLTKAVPDDNPEWGDAEFSRARPASQVLPELFGKQTAEKLLRPRGRPKLAKPKQAVKLRIDPDVIDAYKSEGEGWQTRMNDALREVAKARGLMG